MDRPVPKKPKIEIVIENDDDDNNCKANKKTNQDDYDVNKVRWKEQEEALITALIQHRTEVVQYLRTRLTYYYSQLEEAEKLLEDAQLKLARSCSQKSISTAREFEKSSPNLEQVCEGSSSFINQPKLKVLREVATLSKTSDMLEGRPASISTTTNLSGKSIKEIKLEKGLPSSAPLPENTPVKLNHSKPYPAREAVDSSRNSEGLGSGSTSSSEHSKKISQSQSRSKSQLMMPSMKPNQPVNTSPNQQSIISSGSGMVKQEADLSHRKSPQQEAERKLATSEKTAEKPCCMLEKDSRFHQRVLHHPGLHILSIEATMIKMKSSKSVHFDTWEISQVNQDIVRDFNNPAMYGRSYVRRNKGMKANMLLNMKWHEHKSHRATT